MIVSFFEITFECNAVAFECSNVVMRQSATSSLTVLDAYQNSSGQW